MAIVALRATSLLEVLDCHVMGLFRAAKYPKSDGASRLPNMDTVDETYSTSKQEEK